MSSGGDDDSYEPYEADVSESYGSYTPSYSGPPISPIRYSRTPSPSIPQESSEPQEESWRSVSDDHTRHSSVVTRPLMRYSVGSGPITIHTRGKRVTRQLPHRSPARNQPRAFEVGGSSRPPPSRAHTINLPPQPPPRYDTQRAWDTMRWNDPYAQMAREADYQSTLRRNEEEIVRMRAEMETLRRESEEYRRRNEEIERKVEEMQKMWEQFRGKPDD